MVITFYMKDEAILILMFTEYGLVIYKMGLKKILMLSFAAKLHFVNIYILPEKK